MFLGFAVCSLRRRIRPDAVFELLISSRTSVPHILDKGVSDGDSIYLGVVFGIAFVTDNERGRLYGSQKQ